MKKEIIENKSFAAKVIVKVFTMNPSADVHFGVQPQSKRIPEKLVKEESKRKSLVSLLEVTQGNRAVILRVEHCQYDGRYLLEWFDHKVTMEDVKTACKLAMKEWKIKRHHYSTCWFADDERRKQRKIALALTLDNKTDYYKWIAFPFNMVINTYDTLYTALTSSTVIDSLKRFLSFINMTSIVFNGPGKNFILTFYDNSVYANFYIDIDKLLRLMQSDAFGVRYQYTKRAVA